MRTRAFPAIPRAFSLIELLVALAVFAALAAVAYGGLSEIARVRGALAEKQDRFATIVRAMATIERDLRQAVSRPVRGNGRGEELPALIGGADRVELTHLGFANPLAEPRSNLERVAYALDANGLERGRYAVLDRAPDSAPATRVMLTRVGAFRLRYLGIDNTWREAWPPTGISNADALAMLPRAVEFRIDTADAGELRRVVELASTLATTAPDAPSKGGGTLTPPTNGGTPPPRT